MSEVTTHPAANTNEAQFLAPETSRNAARHERGQAGTAEQSLGRDRRSFLVEATLHDPSKGERRNVVVGEAVVATTREASERARFMLQRGWWVEVYDHSTRELLAGPFDPDQRLPAFIV